MNRTFRTLDLHDPDETAAIAVRLGAQLQPGDCLLMQGPIGAGKTHFARHLIQSLLAEPEDVPSPTFTLVQIYATTVGELWHADLYRLNSLDEIGELGLVQAFETAICLVEWPEKLEETAPQNALWLKFEPDPADPQRRRLTLSSADPKWAERLELEPHG